MQAEYTKENNSGEDEQEVKCNILLTIMLIFINTFRVCSRITLILLLFYFEKFHYYSWVDLNKSPEECTIIIVITESVELHNK